MANTILTRSECYNPFFCNGKEVSFIEFTKNGSPIACKNNGWFDYSNNSFKSLILPFEVKNKRVYSNKPEAFLIKSNNDYKSGYKLVIPIEFLSGFEMQKNIKASQTDLEIRYHDIIQFNLIGIRAEYVQDNIKGFVRKYTEEKEHTIRVEVNMRFEDTKTGEQYKQFSEAAKSANVNLSFYDFARLAKVFNISLK